MYIYKQHGLEYYRFDFARSLSVSNCFRKRTDIGVISRYSSSVIISRPRSMVISHGGVIVIASSEPEARMFVSCFPFVGFTVISSPFDVLPMTIPTYTSVVAPM